MKTVKNEIYFDNIGPKYFQSAKKRMKFSTKKFAEQYKTSHSKRPK